jgi:hypothetical protein
VPLNAPAPSFLPSSLDTFPLIWATRD